MKLSVIIPNYNYADYVGAAIESALGLEWPNTEIIVVDDGSTDRSREVVERYRGRVSILFQENATQRVACNQGFARSTGEVIIFLDSDDMLHPSIAQEIANVWRESISKVQFQMERINNAGLRTGSIFPVFDPMPTPELIRHWFFTTTAYPTPPGSGNAYSRRFLEKIFPLDDSCGAFSDSACLSSAPILGDIITVAKPLVFYRVHGKNDSNLMIDDTRFAREVSRAQARLRFAKRIGDSCGISLSERNLFKSLHLLQHRVCSLRLTPALHPLAGDSRSRAFWDAVRAIWSYSQMSRKRRLVVGTWAIITILMPGLIARRLIAARFRR